MKVVPVIDEHDARDGAVCTPVKVKDRARIVSHPMAGGTVVRVIGDVDLSVATALRTAFENALAAHPWIIVDLRRAGSVDSVGLGVLIAARQAARRRAGDLLLAAAPPSFAPVLHAARLGAVFATFDTVPQAITFALAPRADQRAALDGRRRW